MTQFTGCIDIHGGKVKQIVGGSLSNDESALRTNHVSTHPSSYFAELYRANDVRRSHIIKLGPGCNDAAEEALSVWPGHLQVGGGITDENASEWIAKGASKVIVTSYLFPGGDLSWDRLAALERLVGPERLVIDLSCRSKGDGWVVAMDRWQRLTNFELTEKNIRELATHCSEFLVHAADVEGLCRGIDEKLVEKLAEWSPIPVVYAGGGRSLEDLELVNKISHGRVDLTFGSALDIFGGTGVRFEDAVKWNKAHK